MAKGGNVGWRAGDEKRVQGADSKETRSPESRRGHEDILILLQ